MNISKEPVAWAALGRAILVAAAAFGLELNPEQIAGLVLVVEAATAILVRRNVEPEARKRERRIAEQLELIKQKYDEGGYLSFKADQ